MKCAVCTAGEEYNVIHLQELGRTVHQIQLLT